MEGRESFEGQDVVGVECRVAGDIGDARLNEILGPDERVVLVWEATMKRVEHIASDGAVVRRQHFKVTEGFVIKDETDSDDLIHGLRAARKKALDDLLGTPPLEGFDGDE